MPRIPLTGVYNTRPGTGALSGTAGIVGIGVVGIMIVGNSGQGSRKDHRSINRLQVTETDQLAQSKRLYSVKRPGLAASTTPRAGHIGNAIKVWLGQGSGTKVMTAFGNTDFKLFDGITDKGDGTGKATFITETLISGVPTLTITSDDNTAWWWQDGGTLTKIVDVDYPANVAGQTITGPMVHMDGFGFQLTTSCRLYNSDVNSVVNHTANRYITANSEPDIGVAALRCGSYIIAFCKRHFDVFRNAGNSTNSILDRVEGMTKRIGMANQHAWAQLKDTIYFAGSSEGANLGLYSYLNGQVQKLSTPEQDSAMAIAGPSNVTLSIVGFYGRQHVLVSASSSTFAYCIEEGNWYELNGANLWYKSDAVISGSTIVTYTISKASTSGKVYVLNPASVVYRDDGVPITGVLQTAKWDGGSSKRKRCPTLDIVGDQTTASAILNVAHSDDDYQTWSTPRQVDMSEKRPALTRCGQFRRRSWLLTDSADDPMRLEALEPEIMADR